MEAQHEDGDYAWMSCQTVFRLVIAFSIGITLGCAEPPAPLVSPTPTNASTSAAGPDGSTLKVSAPTPIWPAGGEVVDDDDPDLVIQNASGIFVEGLPLRYVFEVFDADNRLVYRSDPLPGGTDGRTTHEVGVPLPFDQPFGWRAYAVYDGAYGPTSETADFRTFNRFGVSCAHLGSELAIVQCRRAQYGHMSVPERIEFLTRVAYDLNRAPAEHAPYGLLIKSTGHSCLGYSCDIICSNRGMHRQWDVLTDEDAAQVPVWTRLHQIAVRPCEAVQ